MAENKPASRRKWPLFVALLAVALFMYVSIMYKVSVYGP
jgi:hypothetical protein